MDKVTFVMPAYNVEAYIAEAVESVLAQTVPDWELIIVDDCSSDFTHFIAEEFSRKDHRIKIVRLDRQSGSVYIPRKRAVMEAATKWIAPMDADDRIPPDYLDTLIQSREESDAHIVYPVMYSWDGESITPISTFDNSLTGKCLPGKECVKLTLDGWKIHCGGGLIERDLYLRMFDEIDEQKEDCLAYIDEYLTRLLLYGAKRVKIAPVQYWYRVNPDSVTHTCSSRTFGLLNNNLRILGFVGRHYPIDSETYLMAQRQNFHGVFDGMRLLEKIKVGLHDRRKCEDIIKRCRKKIDRKLLRGVVSDRYMALSWLPYGVCKKVLRIIDSVYRH